jgi:hypothetical protein
MARPAQTHVPGLRRPDVVAAAVAELDSLDGRLAEARAQLHEAESSLQEAEHDDRERSAIAVRAGRQIAGEPSSVQKARARVADASRTLDVLKLARLAAETDLETAIADQASDWTRELEVEQSEARQRARDLLAELETAILTMSEATSVRGWLASPQPLERPPAPAGTAIAAKSSGFQSTNGVPFNAAQLLGWLSEAVDPPQPKPKPILHTPAEAFASPLGLVVPSAADTAA